MTPNTNEQSGQEPILDTHTVQALPITFTHSEIAQNYAEGIYHTRVQAEVEDILRECFPGEENSAPNEAIIPVTESETLRKLHVIALIQNGEILPLLDIEHLPIPLTQIQKIQLFNAVARTLNHAVAAILDDRTGQQNTMPYHHPDVQDDRDDDPGTACHAG